MIMVRAIFFDWFNTLARFEPSREELHNQIYQEYGIPLKSKDILKGLLLADKEWFENNTRSKLKEASPQEQLELGIHYEQIILAEAGIEVSRETLVGVLRKVQQLYKGMTFALFGDVLAVLEKLDKRDFVLGLVTNVARDMDKISRGLGLEPYIDFIVTSEEVGADKPDPAIFRAALDRAGVNAAEAIHVGDQYKLDVIGARKVGITPILIDRFDLYPEITDCARIHNLTEIEQYL